MEKERTDYPVNPTHISYTSTRADKARAQRQTPELQAGEHDAVQRAAAGTLSAPSAGGSRLRWPWPAGPGTPRAGDPAGRYVRMPLACPRFCLGFRGALMGYLGSWFFLFFPRPSGEGVMSARRQLA